MSSVQTSIRRRRTVVCTEHAEQVALVQWFRLQYPGVRIFAVPNAGQRSPAAAAWFRAEGMSPGVPDLWIPEWRMAIEMKRARGGRVTAKQSDWADYLRGIGWVCILARGCEDAIQQVRRAQRTSASSLQHVVHESDHPCDPARL